MADANKLYKQGCDLIVKHAILQTEHGNLPSTPDGPDVERDIRDGIALLKRVVPESESPWAVWWMIGKGHQRLRQHPAAYEAFEKANRTNPARTDVLRELALESMYMGYHEEALEITKRAAALCPEDAGLRANVGLSLLLVGEVEEAQEAVEEAFKMCPEDRVTRQLLDYIRLIKEGGVPCPRSAADVDEYEKRSVLQRADPE